jgi:hypothetical protein
MRAAEVVADLVRQDQAVSTNADGGIGAPREARARVGHDPGIADDADAAAIEEEGHLVRAHLVPELAHRHAVGIAEARRGAQGCGRLTVVRGPKDLVDPH